MGITATPFVSHRLLPDYDTPLVDGRALGNASRDEFATKFPSTAATATITVAVAGAENDEIDIIIDGITVDVTVGATPTTSSVAAQIADAINAKAELGGVVTAAAVAAVVTVTAVNAGLAGNELTLAEVVTGTADLTLSGAKLSGGTGTITPQTEVSLQVGKSTVALIPNRPIVPSSELLTAIIASGVPFK